MSGSPNFPPTLTVPPTKSVRLVWVTRHGWAADAPVIDRSRQARYHYSKRFDMKAHTGSASNSRFDHDARACGKGIVRLDECVVGECLEVFILECVAMPSRGGRHLCWWPFVEFIDIVRRAAWTALALDRPVPVNRPPSNRGHW